MSKQRKMHHEKAARQYTYKVARKWEFKFGYKHKPRWRQISGGANVSSRQAAYTIFGPSFMGAGRK